MAKDEYFTILILITLLLDIASSLYLSKDYAVKNVGEPFIVLCKDEGGLSVIWKGPKGRLGAKTHPKVQLGSYGTSIIFNQTRRDDSGEYTCTSPGSKTSKTFNLIVEDRELPSTTKIVDVHTESEVNHNASENFTFVDTPDKQVAVEGQPGRVRCEVNLNNVVITWSLANGTDLNGSDTEVIGADGYLITNTTREHANHYICRALHKNSGRMITRNITFVVEHKPYLIYAQENVVYGILGETVNLTCEVEANPTPKFKWHHRGMGKIIQESSHKSVLQLNMTEEVPGEYICNASNKRGALEKIFQLGIGIKPDAPQNVTLIAAKPNSLDIFIDTSNSSIELEYYMEPEWIIIEYRPVGADDMEWNQANISISENQTVLENLEKNTKYEIRVAIKNKASLSDYYMTVFETSLASSIHMTSPIFNILVYLITLFTSKLWMA